MNSTLSLSHEISSAAECSDCIAGMPRSVYYVYIAQTYMQSYVLPVICAFGLVANLGIIYVYARPAAGRECGRSTRLYYLVISIADEVNLLFQHTLISFLDFGLGYLTGGSFYWPIARTSDFTCKLWEYVWPWSEQVAGYTMVIFSLERFSAVWFPLKAKTWLSPRKAYLALGLMALAVSSVNAIPAVAAYVYVLPNQVYGTSCMARSDPVALNQAFYFNISFLSMGVPTFCTLMLNVLISVGILQQASLRYALQHSKGSSSISNSTSSLNSSAGGERIGGREANAVVCLLTISFIYVLTFTPVSIFWLWLSFLSTGLAATDSTTYSIVIYACYLSLNISSLPHAVNFLIYFWRVPYFRRTLLCCRYLRIGGSSSKFSTTS